PHCGKHNLITFFHHYGEKAVKVRIGPTPFFFHQDIHIRHRYYSDFNGFFSIVVEKGDQIVFSAVGYRTVEYTIPDSLSDNRYSLVQLMTQDAVNLPETVVFPWPSRDHFKLEFLAMDVTPELQERASRNLANETLERMRSEVATDGVENSSYYLRQQSREYYYIGQRPPMNIFSPVAWKQFFDAWKRGDYKRKRDDR
ncbi:MAG: hypothetical protein AAFY48_15220, partial [Bacteroidota bacterium]